MAEAKARVGLPTSFTVGCQLEPLTAAFLAGPFFLCRFLCCFLRRFLPDRFCFFPGGRFFFRFLLDRFSFFPGGRFFCRFLCRLLGCFLGRLFLRRRLLLRGAALATARWSYRRRFSHRWQRLDLVVFLYENGFFFLFFLFFQILFQRFAVGAAVSVLIRLIVPTVESRIIEVHISS